MIEGPQEDHTEIEVTKYSHPDLRRFTDTQQTALFGSMIEMAAQLETEENEVPVYKGINQADILATHAKLLEKAKLNGHDREVLHTAALFLIESATFLEENGQTAAAGIVRDAAISMGGKIYMELLG